jgi:hypothetical protein
LTFAAVPPSLSGEGLTEKDRLKPGLQPLEFRLQAVSPISWLEALETMSQRARIRIGTWASILLALLALGARADEAKAVVDAGDFARPDSPTAGIQQAIDGFRPGDEVALLDDRMHGWYAAHPIVKEIQPGRLTFGEPIASAHAEGIFSPERHAFVVDYFPMIRASRRHSDQPVTDVALLDRPSMAIVKAGSPWLGRNPRSVATSVGSSNPRGFCR